MTGQTAWVQRIPNWSTLAEQVERGGQITTKVNYTALPADNSVGVYSMKMDSVHELLWVGTEKEGQSVTFLIPYYFASKIRRSGLWDAGFPSFR
jgi:hypothetical protein